MKIINKSRKIIGINGEPLLPGKDMELPIGFENHPNIKMYLCKGTIVDADKERSAVANEGISDFEKAKIAEEAIARYKAEQESLAAVQAEKDAEIKALKAMKKDELLKKAVGMGIEIKDDEPVDSVREKILAALNV